MAAPAEHATGLLRLRDEIDAHLRGLTFSSDPAIAGLDRAMRYSLDAGGKRLRPVLTLAAADALELPHERVMPLATAIELIHTLSLIHDDLPAMDDADTRRGRPSHHVVFGEALAILTGDALFAEAIRSLLCDTPAPADRVLRAAQILLTAVGPNGMAGGQFIDLQGSAVGQAALAQMEQLKTGSLFDACIRSVIALAEDPDPRVTAALTSYAYHLGALYQIVDDILDITATSEQLGKPVRSDVRNGRRTFAVGASPRRAIQLADDHLDQIRSVLVAAPCDTEALMAIAEYVRRRAEG